MTQGAGSGLSPALVALLTSTEGQAFCQLLRRFYYEELHAGHIAPGVAPGEAPLLQSALSLGLLRQAGKPGMLRLTELGYEIGNVAKEYTNWLDTGRQLPEGVEPSHVAGRRVLDVGCGFGRYLLGFGMHGADAHGIDFQHNYLRLSSTFAAQQGLAVPKVSRARAEQLPFRSGSFDVVFCRLVINYVADIDATIGEFVRVLASGGILVLIVDPLTVPLRTLARSKWWDNRRTVGFTLFGLLNTVVLQTIGRQVTIRTQGRMHAQHSPAWPTAGWFSRRLAAHGFAPITGGHFRDRRYAGVYLGRLK